MLSRSDLFSLEIFICFNFKNLENMILKQIGLTKIEIESLKRKSKSPEKSKINVNVLKSFPHNSPSFD